MKTNIFTLLMLCISLSFYAQKSAPIAGDSATLIDLLKKDYQTIPPDTREEEIIRDRAQVIGIFKSYLTNNEKLTLKYTSKSSPELKIIKDGLEKKKKSLETLKQSSIQFSSSYEASDYLEDIEDAEDSISESNQTFYKLSYESDFNEFSQLQNTYSENSYIKAIIEKFVSKYEGIYQNKIDSQSEVNYESSIQKSLPFLGGDLAFETIIDGLSRFLVKRIKEELTIHVIDKIKEELKNPTPESYLNELMTLLPTTTDYINGFDADQVLNFIDEIKQYIEDDLNHLLPNASNLKDTPRFKTLIKNNADLDFAFEALELIPQLSKIKNPVDYFDMLNNSRNLSRWAKITEAELAITNQAKRYNIVNALKMASLLAHSMTALDNGELKFVNSSFISNYGSEIDFYLLYIGFLNQQEIKYFNIHFYNEKDGKKPISFNHLMRVASPENIDNTNEYVQLIQSELGKVATHTEKLYNSAVAIKKEKSSEDKVNIETIHSFIESIISLAEEVTISAENLIIEIPFESIEPQKVNIKGNTDSYFKIAKTSNEILLDLHHKKYSTAIIKAIEISSNFSGTEFSNAKITGMVNQLRNAKNLLLLKELFSYSENKIPTDNKKYLALKSIILQIDAEVSKLSSPEEIREIITNIKAEIDKGDNGSNDEYVTHYTQLRKHLNENPDLKKWLNTNLPEIDILNYPLLPQHKYEVAKEKLQNIISDFNSNISNFSSISSASLQQNITYSDYVSKRSGIKEQLTTSKEVVKTLVENFNTDSKGNLLYSKIPIKNSKKEKLKLALNTIKNRLPGNLNIINTTLINNLETYLRNTLSFSYQTTYTKLNDAYKEHLNFIKIAEKSKILSGNFDELPTLDSSFGTKLSGIQSALNGNNFNQLPQEFFTKVNELKDVIVNKKISVYKVKRKVLKDYITTNIKDIVQKFSGINIEGEINKPLDKYLSVLDEDDKESIKNALKQYTKTIVEAIVFNGNTDYQKIIEDNEYVKAKEELLSYLYAYTPEISQNVFKVQNKTLLKTIHFVNDIALSENAEDVEAAIDAFALPAGSFSVKKKRGHYIAINAFPGMLFGTEQRTIKPTDEGFVALTAPIGLYSKLWNFKLNKKSKNYCSLGIFIPIIDIAAPVHFRFDASNDESNLGDFDFENIFSPGAYLTIAPGKSPITINIGAQYGPELKEIIPASREQEGVTNVFDDSFRYSIGVTFDIPIFKLYSKNR